MIGELEYEWSINRNDSGRVALAHKLYGPCQSELL